MRRLKYNHHIETDADFAVIDDPDSCRWYEYIAEDFHQKLAGWLEAARLQTAEESQLVRF